MGGGQPDLDDSGGLKGSHESKQTQQLDSPDKFSKEKLSKSQRKRMRKREKDREKRKREQEEEQESGHVSNRFNPEEDTSIGLDSADGSDQGRKKKKKKKKK